MLYLVFKKSQKEVTFDYIEYGPTVKILSYDFFELLTEYGLSENHYELSKLKLVDKNCNEITDKKYVALRFGKFDDDLFELHKETSIRTKIHGSTKYLYPHLELKKSQQKKVFNLKEFSYRQSIIFEGTELDTLKGFGLDLDIYKLSDFPFVYANQYDENVLPLENQYRIK